MTTEREVPYFSWRDEVDSRGLLQRFWDPPSVTASFPIVRIETSMRALVRVIGHDAMDRWTLWVPRISVEGGAGVINVELRASVMEGFVSTVALALAKGIPTFALNPLFSAPIRGLNAIVWTVWASVDTGSADAELMLIGDRSSCCELGQ